MKGEKIIASVLAAIIALAPIVSAAVTLGDYPTFLFKDHNLNAYVVVGADAQPADVVGAVDLAVRLAGESYEEVSTTGGTTITGGTSEEIALGQNIAGTNGLDPVLKQYKLPGLKDSSVSFQDDTYDFHEEIELSQSGLPVQTSLTSSEEKYADGVYLEVDRNTITYKFVFDDPIYVSNATSDEPLEIEFLGKTLVIEKVESASKFTVRVGEEYTLNVDDSVTVNGKKVTLKNVGSSGTTAIVDVDGVVASVSTTPKTVNGLKVKVTNTFYADAREERMATLLIGTETTKTYNSGDPYIGEDKNNPNWVWYLASLTTNTPTIAIRNNFVKDGYSDNPVTVGQCYTLPNNYAKICLDSLTVNSYQPYQLEVATNVDLHEAGGIWASETKATVLKITSPGQKEGLLLTSDLGDKKTDTVYLKLNTTSQSDLKADVFYIDDSKPKHAGTVRVNETDPTAFAYVNYQDTKGTDLTFKIHIHQVGSTNYFDVILDRPDDSIKTKWAVSGGNFDHLGDNADDADADEIVWNDTKSIGTKKYDQRTAYGVVVKDPNSNGGSDKVVLHVPGDQVKAKVVVYGPGGTSSTTEGGKIKKVVPVTTTVAKLDTEVDPTTVGKHLVLVGGPAVNRLTAQAMGLSYPTYGSSGLLPFSEGEGYIKVYDGVFKPGQVVVVVAGWEAENTRMATSLLQQYDTFAEQLGNNVAVKVTSLSASGIRPA